MKTITVNLYQFSELSEQAKKYAINKHYENEQYPFLSEDLIEFLKETLKENNCEFDNLKLYYSLSYSQGDGLCFIGELTKNNKTLILKHYSHYYYSTSVNMQFIDNETGDEIETDNELKNIYLSTCNKLEEYGYSILEYRMNIDEFTEFSDLNEYLYYENGTQY